MLHLPQILIILLGDYRTCFRWGPCLNTETLNDRLNSKIRVGEIVKVCHTNTKSTVTIMGLHMVGNIGHMEDSIWYQKVTLGFTYANFTLVYGWYANCNIVMFVIIGSEIHILYYYTIQGGNVLHIRFHKSMLYLLKNAWQLLSRWLRYELWTSGESIGESKLLKVILTLPPPPLRKGNPADTHLSSSHVFLHWRS